MPATRSAVAPLHPGVMLADILGSAGLSVRQAATRLGVTHPTLNNVVNCDASVSTDMALRLAALFGNSPEFWTNLQRNHDLWHRSAALASELARIERFETAEAR